MNQDPSPEAGGTEDQGMIPALEIPPNPPLSKGGEGLAEFLAGPEFFDCERLRARISARQCLLNQGKASGFKRLGTQYMGREAVCLDCPEGRMMEAWAPGAFAGRGRLRARGVCGPGPRGQPEVPPDSPLPKVVVERGNEGPQATEKTAGLAEERHGGGAPGLLERKDAMNDNALQIVIHNAFYRCTYLMSRKSREYSPGEDRLENFKEAGALQLCSPEEALFGMLAKHLVSLNMMCRGVTQGEISAPGLWEEKLTDAHNYLFLLEALVKERYGWGPEVETADEEG
jgi:hypothetical protein